MKNLILHIVLLFTFLNATPQEVNVIIKEAEKQEALLNESAALSKYLEVVKLQPGNLPAIIKCSELCARIGKRQTNAQSRDHYYATGKKFAEIALKRSPDNSDANAVMAMVLGHMSLSKSNKEKLNTSKDIRKYVDAALKANPNNYRALHILGRWHYELSNLNGIEKAAVKVFYGGLPTASLKECITAFEKAQTITGGFVLNCYELARAYKRNNETTKAIAMLQKMQTLPNHTQDDAATKEAGKKLLKQWQ